MTAKRSNRSVEALPGQTKYILKKELICWYIAVVINVIPVIYFWSIVDIEYVTGLGKTRQLRTKIII